MGEVKCVKGWNMSMIIEKDSECVKGKIGKDKNLVDPASSHTLVSKIKPCMCKYK